MLRFRVAIDNPFIIHSVLGAGLGSPKIKKCRQKAMLAKKMPRIFSRVAPRLSAPGSSPEQKELL